MALPYFFEEIISNDPVIILSENTSRHIIQVLRLKAGDKVMITDGKGKIAECRIIQHDKKSAKVEVSNLYQQEKSAKQVTIGISPIKNAGRFEWFLEKAAELGIDDIILLNCDHSEKQNVRYDRLQNILVSAMLQSRQSWLPKLAPVTSFTMAVPNLKHQHKLIAHCYTGEKDPLASLTKVDDVIILIGPEGDFSKEEIAFALQHDFKPVSLGNTRLRTETAGIAAAVLLKLN